MKNYYSKFLALFIAIFGMLTLYLSGSLIFDLFGVRETQGNYVSFVVWANFISSLIYFSVAVGLWNKKAWTIKWLLVSIIILVTTYIVFWVYILLDGVYEEKTVFAVPFRIGVTSIFLFFNWLIYKKEVSPAV
jgi:ABC-type Na+ efflux pump permease subunit